jgi:hypothetical protein
MGVLMIAFFIIALTLTVVDLRRTLSAYSRYNVKFWINWILNSVALAIEICLILATLYYMK